MIRAACFIAVAAIAFDAAALERSSPGSQLKTTPGPSRSTLTAPAPAAPAMPPAVATAPIRLFGPKSAKPGTELPLLVATPALQLFGSQGAFGTVKTASLVLHGPMKGSAQPIHVKTDPIRLWGSM
jgi:hypothetical protein